MIGFLGTVIGMIVAIHELANAGGQIDIKMLSDGLYTAMTTTVALTRSIPCCISNRSPAQPATSVISSASSNTLPLPSPISSCKADSKNIPEVTTNVTNLDTPRPIKHSHDRCQSMIPPTRFQSFGNNLGKNQKYLTDQKCTACDNNLWFLSTAHNLDCHSCKRNPKDSTGQTLLWDCVRCQYLSCRECLQNWQKVKKKKRKR